MSEVQCWNCEKMFTFDEYMKLTMELKYKDNPECGNITICDNCNKRMIIGGFRLDNTFKVNDIYELYVATAHLVFNLEMTVVSGKKPKFYESSVYLQKINKKGLKLNEFIIGSEIICRHDSKERAIEFHNDYLKHLHHRAFGSGTHMENLVKKLLLQK